MLSSRLSQAARLRGLRLLARRAGARGYAAKVLKSRFGEVEVPDQTISRFILSNDATSDDLPALTCGVSGRSYTYGALRMMTRQGAMAFVEKLPLRRGETVGLLLPNIPEFTITVYAIFEAGLVATFANPLFTADEISRQFVNAKVRCIVTVPQLLDCATTVSKALPDYVATLNIGGENEPDKKILGLQSMLTESYSAELPRVPSTQIAVLPYSSGTTGLPKAVMLTHRNLTVNLLQCWHPDIVRIYEPQETRETVFSVLPFFHIMGFNCIMNFLMYCGIHLITIPRFTPEDYLACLAKHRPTALFVVPSLLKFLVSHPSVTADHLASVGRIVSGAAPLSKSLINKMKEKLGRDDCSVEQGYGLSEASPCVLYVPRNAPSSKDGSCGKLLASTEARVVDLTSGTDVDGPGRPGELWIRGPQVMKGYLNDPAATAEILDDDGWLHTGDIVYYDEDEYFYAVDRTKELIKVKGNQVSPSELESIISEIPGVLDVAVVGIPDSFAGELPRAFVVKKSDSDINQGAVQDYVASKVAAYKKLAAGVYFIESIPRNPSGKVLRSELKNFPV